MVSQGYATAYQRYSRDYVGIETTARALKRGLWAGTFDPPSDWRRAKRASGVETRPEMEKPLASIPTPAQATCAIKVNISRKGDKIYHLPGSRAYDRTVITTGSGERMFCSEDEAKAAGWRRRPAADPDDGYGCEKYDFEHSPLLVYSRATATWWK